MGFKRSFIVAISCLNILAACNSHAQQTELSVAEFEKAIAQSNIQVLDVRTQEEYQSGYLKNALLADWNNEAEFQQRVKALDKNLPVYTYCLGGARSSAATQYLRKNGFTAYNLSGGISAWKRDNKPVEQAAMVRQMNLQEYLAQIPTDETVLVDFSAVWCPPCKKMTPLLDSLEKTNGHQFLIVKINGGEQSEICKELKISGFPTFIIYKQGKEVWRREGLVEGKEFIEQF